MPLWGTCVALMNVMSISWHLILIFTPMHFSYSNKSIHYLNQDKHIYQDAHWEKCIGVSAEHASAGTRVLSASTRVPEHLSLCRSFIVSSSSKQVLAYRREHTHEHNNQANYMLISSTLLFFIRFQPLSNPKRLHEEFNSLTNSTYKV